MFRDINIYPFSLDIKNNETSFVSFPFIAGNNQIKDINCGISLIYAGDMINDNDNKNRQKLFNKLGLNPERVYGLKQIHSRYVILVDGKNNRSVEADGMVTNDKDIVLSVTTADCLPIYLYDAKSGVFGIVHSGWRGTGIVINAVNLMKENFGTKASDIAAVLGPCIDSCCYKVDQQRAACFKKEFGPESVREFLYGGTSLSEFSGISIVPGNAAEIGKDYFLDLKTANINLLIEAGVRNISVCEDCTYTDERLGSFRREGKNFTHMAALAGIIPQPFG